MASFSANSAAPNASVNAPLSLSLEGKSENLNFFSAESEETGKSCEDSKGSHHNSEDGGEASCCFLFCATGASLVQSEEFRVRPSGREPLGVHAELISVVSSGFLRPPQG